MREGERRGRGNVKDHSDRQTGRLPVRHTETEKMSSILTCIQSFSLCPELLTPLSLQARNTTSYCSAQTLCKASAHSGVSYLYNIRINKIPRGVGRTTVCAILSCVEPKEILYLYTTLALAENALKLKHRWSGRGISKLYHDDVSHVTVGDKGLSVQSVSSCRL